jgi:hypothetical protein
MIRRCTAVLALLLAAGTVGAAPASARSSDGDFSLGRTRIGCGVPDRAGRVMNVVLQARQDTARRASVVDYAVFGPDGWRGAVLMPIGSGRMSVLELDLLTLGGDEVRASRPGVTPARRYACSLAEPGAPSGTVTVAFVVQPVRPTPAEVEAYCAEFGADRPADDWEREHCVSGISRNLGMVGP